MVSQSTHTLDTLPVHHTGDLLPHSLHPGEVQTIQSDRNMHFCACFVNVPLPARDSGTMTFELGFRLGSVQDLALDLQ